VEQAKAAGGGADIHSPVDGIVVARQESQGQAVDPSMKELVKIGTALTSLTVVSNDANLGVPIAGGTEGDGAVRRLGI